MEKEARMDLHAMFATVTSQKASDLLLKVGVPPALRIAGSVRYQDGPPLSAEHIQRLYEQVAPERVRRMFERENEADTAYEILGVGRFRVNIFRQRGQMGMVFRYVPNRIPTLEELDLPAEILTKLASLPRGLLLVTGVTGSGKSTTLASMINFVNTSFHKHIVTIEDPIEFIFHDDKSMIDQRELGIDTFSFAAALRHVVRQSPDIIMIGELRDMETMEAALHAAETGHLVLSTLHTRNAMQTIERIMNFFPPHQHEFLRQQLSLNLEGSVAMRLVPTIDGTARKPAVEIMTGSPTVRELLYAGRFREVGKAIKAGGHFGCQTFNQCLKEFFTKELVSLEEALRASDNPEELRMEIRGISKTTKTADFDFKI